MLSHLSKRSLYLPLIAILAIILLATSIQARRAAAQLSITASASSCLTITGVYNGSNSPYVLDLGDVDGDSKLDLAIANRSTNRIAVARGNGTGGFLTPVSYTVGNLPVFVEWGDINSDGKLDLATVNETSNNVSVLLNTGTGTLGAATNYAVGSTPHAVALKDVSEDGHLDMIVTNRGSHTVSVFINTGTGAFKPRVDYSAASTPMRFDLGDINNDGHIDIATSSAGSSNATLLFGDGTGVFGAPSYYPVTTSASSTTALALADLNGDGALDIVATTGIGNTVNVALGDGSGGFGVATAYPVGSNSISVAIGDLDGDSALDLVVANWYSYYISILRGNGGGTFQTTTNYSISGGSNYATLGDLNADGRLDIVVANHGVDKVSVLLGQPADLTPPTGSIQINQGATATASPAITLNLSAQDTGCGVASMALSNDGINFNAFEPYASTKAWTLPAGDGAKTVYATFKDRADNVSQVVSATIVLDQTSPTGSVAINNGAAYTTNGTTTLALAASDTGTGVKQMSLSDGVTSSGWISYTTSAAWTFAGGDGNKTISARFRDAAGNISALATATIALDTLSPSATVSPLSSYQVSLTFPITVTGVDATSGVASYDIEFRDGASGSWTGWLTETTDTTASFTGQDGHTYSFRARAHDNAGNVGGYSAGDTQTTVDATIPTTNRFLINFGALETTGVTVSLSLGVSDATSGVAEMSFSNDGTIWSGWQPYVPTAIWSLAASDGEKTVYGRFRDAAGNISAVISDTIVLNTFVATEYGLTINEGSLFTNQTTVTLTIGAPAGTTQMQVSNDGGFAGVSWEPYTSHKTWQITQYGTYVLPRIVYIKYKDRNGTVSSHYQDDIILDVRPPHGWVNILNLNSAQTSVGAEATLQFGADDDVSGVGDMRVSNQTSFDGAIWQPYATMLAWDLGNSNAVYVQFRDNAGNISQTYTATRIGTQNVFLPFLTR